MGQNQRSTTNDSGNHNEKYMKKNFNSADDLPIKKTLELYNMMIVIRLVFDERSKYYSI